MNCVVCAKPQMECAKPKLVCYTCSMSCAAVLAQATRYVNQKKKDYMAPEKQKIRELLFKKYIKPIVACAKPCRECFRILDFWGGGAFSDYILDHTADVNNHAGIELYEIDQDKRLFPALRKYAVEKNQLTFVNNQPVHVRPFCGSLAKFVHGNYVKYHPEFDLIWLDYCGSFINLREDIEHVVKISNIDTVLAITIFRGRDNAIDGKNRQKTVDNLIQDYLPLHQRVLTESYCSENGAMEVYVYKVPAKLKAMKFLRRKEVEIYGTPA